MEKPIRTQRGFTMVELMVALVIGLLITGTAAALFLQASRAHAEDDRYARMLENGRFALDLLAEDLRMADFWGEMLEPGLITNAAGAAGEDCGLNLFSGNNRLFYDNNHLAVPSITLNVNSAGCTAVTGAITPGTDVLGFKRAAGTSTTSAKPLPIPNDQVVYLRTNGTIGSFVNAGTPAAGQNDWEYLPRLYFIRNNQLCRADISANQLGAVAVDGCLADDVQDLHIQFGIDTDGDGVANQYLSNPTLAQLETAVLARIYLLMRATDPDRDYTDAKTYQLGDAPLGPFSDNFYRKVLSTTVSLRNPTNLIIMNN
ncbi:MAG: PilW family protein [Gammaproteobacteria bacterium]